MNRTTGIVLALFLAVICTALIFLSANRKVIDATRTVKVLQATEYIPAGEEITPAMFKVVGVPEQMAQDLATDPAGQFTKVPIMKDQYLMTEDLKTTGRDPGCVEIYVPVDLSSSACAMSGDYVDVYTKAADNNPSVLIYQRAKVLDVVDSNARETEPGKPSSVTSIEGSGTAAAIGIEVPGDQTARIVGPASEKQIYLVESAA